MKLTRKEILIELTNIGIDSLFELKEYCREIEAYQSKMLNSDLYYHLEYQKETLQECKVSYQA